MAIEHEKSPGEDVWKALGTDLNTTSLVPKQDHQRQDRLKNLAGFNLARRVQGRMLDFGIKVNEISPVRLAQAPDFRRLVEKRCAIDDLDAEEVLEEMVYSWTKVLVPDGMSMIRTAVEKAAQLREPARGEYTTLNQKNNASRIWHLLYCLPRVEDGRVFITHKQIKACLNLDINSVRRAIDLLVKYEVIQIVKKGKPNIATRYKILDEPEDESIPL